VLSHTDPPSGPRNVDAVVIGASAGGVTAIITLLEALPADFSAAVVIVLHLPPERSSALVKILARRCALRVKDAEDKETIVPGTVYLAPPDYHVMIEPELTLSLSQDEPEHFSRPSIDVLFESAALAYRDRLLGIVLTGASADGAEGLKTVRQMGGDAWVQDPAEAFARVMPDSAIARARTDRIMPVAKIAAKLAHLGARI
jgi:two-component system, chemotaxis family, protein-glutamate methylesterase/glutaminase